MALDEERLYAALVRQSAYVEGVKNYQLNQYEKFLAQHGEQQRELLKGFKGSASLSELTQAERVKLLRKFNSLNNKNMLSAMNETETLLKRIAGSHRNSTRIIYAAILDGISFRKKLALPSSEKAAKRIARELRANGRAPMLGKALATGMERDPLWARIKDIVNPATGLIYDDQINNLSQHAKDNTLKIVRQAFANGWTVDELSEALTGDETPLGGASVRRQMNNAYASTLPTVTQHISQQISGAVGSAIVDYFQWVSVLDRATTEVCTHRANRMYEYGKDPLPPAHYRCRSTTFPRASNRGGRMDESESFDEWLETEPASIQNDLLGSKVARLFRSGKISDERRRKLEVLASLYPEALEEKTGLMIQ